MNTLLKFIIDNLAFLYGRYGFTFKNSLCDGEEGNALVELHNKSLLIQCIQDRGEISIYIASLQHSKELFELSEIFEISTGKKISYTVPDADAIRFLKQNFDEITDLLTENFSATLQERDKIRKAQMEALGFNKS